MTTAVILFALSNTLKVVYPFSVRLRVEPNRYAQLDCLRAIEKMKVSNSIIV